MFHERPRKTRYRGDRRTAKLTLRRTYTVNPSRADLEIYFLLY